jgi:hypothetical protein
MRLLGLTFLFFIFPKKRNEYSACQSQLDCPRHMFCQKVLGDFGYCKNFPLIPLPIPIKPDSQQQRLGTI